MKRAFPLSVRIPFFDRFRMRVIAQNMPGYVIMLVGIFFANILLIFGLALPQALTHYQEVVQQNLLSSNTQTAAGAGSNFQAMLTNQLQNNAQEFVRAGSIVLKDNNMGSINLILHPESLGNVKINLQLTDKIIAGHITVASKEAFNAFQESLGSLKEAFTQNGFDTASFDLSWSGQGSGTGYEGQQNQQSRMPFNKYRADAAYGEYAYAESTAPAAATKSDYSVDIVA